MKFCNPVAFEDMIGVRELILSNPDISRYELVFVYHFLIK